MELRKYYEELLEMFSTEGWKFFIEDMTRDHGNASSIDGLKDLEGLYFRLGQRQVLSAILMYEELARKGLEDLDADNS